MRVHDICLEDFPHFKMGFEPNFYADWVMLSFLARQVVPEPEVIRVIKRVVRAGDVVIDAGANIGFYSLLMSKMVGEAGRVIAFEPCPINMQHLAHNASINNMTNIAMYSNALWSDVGEVEFYVNNDSGQSSLFSSVDTREVIQVQRLPLDAISEALTGGVRFMKIDVEGSEERALLGARTLLEKGFPTYIVCEINPVALAQLDGHQDTIRNLMASYGWKTFLLHEDGGLPSLVPERTVIRPKKNNTNVLFARMADVQAAWPEAAA